MLLNYIYFLGGIMYLFLYFLLVKPPTLPEDYFYQTAIGVTLIQSIMLAIVHGLMLKHMGVIRVVKKQKAKPKDPEKKVITTPGKSKEDPKGQDTTKSMAQNKK